MTEIIQPMAWIAILTIQLAASSTALALLWKLLFVYVRGDSACATHETTRLDRNNWY